MLAQKVGDTLGEPARLLQWQGVAGLLMYGYVLVDAQLSQRRGCCHGHQRIACGKAMQARQRCRFQRRAAVQHAEYCQRVQALIGIGGIPGQGARQRFRLRASLRDQQ